MASDPIADLAEGISSWAFRGAVAAGLRWGGQLSTRPGILVLVPGGLQGSLQGLKRAERTTEDLVGRAAFSF